MSTFALLVSSPVTLNAVGSSSQRDPGRTGDPLIPPFPLTVLVVPHPPPPCPVLQGFGFPGLDGFASHPMSQVKGRGVSPRIVFSPIGPGCKPPSPLLVVVVNPLNISIGTGKTMVEFFSAAIELRVCRYRSCRADGDWLITSAASFKARDARCSPSAAMTLALASLAASASAAMARCSWTGRRTSLLFVHNGWILCCVWLLPLSGVDVWDWQEGKLSVEREQAKKMEKRCFLFSRHDETWEVSYRSSVSWQLKDGIRWRKEIGTGKGWLEETEKKGLVQENHHQSRRYNITVMLQYCVLYPSRYPWWYPILITQTDNSIFLSDEQMESECGWERKRNDEKSGNVSIPSLLFSPSLIIWPSPACQYFISLSPLSSLENMVGKIWQEVY